MDIRNEEKSDIDSIDEAKSDEGGNENYSDLEEEEENELDIPCSGPTSCFSPPEWQVINHHFTLEEVICINQGHPKFSSMKDKCNLIRSNQSAPYIHSLILFLFSRLNGSGDMYCILKSFESLIGRKASRPM